MPLSERRGAAAGGRNAIAVIGIDSYHAWPSLSNAVRDARAAAALFQRLGFEQVTEPLLDDRATRDAIHALVTDDLRSLGPLDSLVLLFAGHGGTREHDLGDKQVKTGYLIPVDGSDVPNKVATWVELDSWLRTISLLRARHILVILDACYSGIALGPVIRWRDVGLQQGEPPSALNARRSRRIITSALDDQVALDSGPVAEHSLFMGCLIEGLVDDLRRGGRRVATGSELGLYLQRRVAAYPGSRQTPDFGAFDFDDRGELVIPLVTEASEEPADIRSTGRRERARRVLSDACERWLEHSRSERRLLDLETVVELIAEVESATLSAEMIRFLDESAAFHIDDVNEHILAVIGFIRSTEALEAPYTRFTRLLQHASPRLRRGAVSLVREFDRHVANRVLHEHVGTEQDLDIRRLVVAYLRGVGITPSFDAAEKLLAGPADWMTAAWALTACSDRPTALLLGDGTVFAHDMARLVTGAGFRLVDEPDRSVFLHGGLDPRLLDLYAMIVVIRGENYFRGGDNRNYLALAQYVRSGGLLFMTPWVAWETVHLPFAAILPFRHLRSSHNEGVALRACATAAQPAHALFSDGFTLEASYEELVPRDDTTVLLHSDRGVPLYGFRTIEAGECHYLNVCQHHCSRPMGSPLQAEAFAHAMERTWRWLYGRCAARGGGHQRGWNGPMHLIGHGQGHGE